MKTSEVSGPSSVVSGNAANFTLADLERLRATIPRMPDKYMVQRSDSHDFWEITMPADWRWTPEEFQFPPNCVICSPAVADCFKRELQAAASSAFCAMPLFVEEEDVRAAAIMKLTAIAHGGNGRAGGIRHRLGDAHSPGQFH